MIRIETNRQVRITDKKKYLLFSQLYSLLSSGLSFSRSFELLIQGEKKKKEARVLKDVYRRIIEGHEFFKSMQLCGSFTDLDSGVIRIGEETGKISQSLLFLSDYYHKKNEQRRMLVGALSYPLVIVVTAILVLFFMITVVVPMFEQVYSRMGGSLPEITRFTIRLSSYFPAIFTSISLFVLLLLGAKLIYGKTNAYQRITSKILLHIPLIGNLVRSHYQAQFCKLLHLLVGSGIPLLRSLDMLGSIIRFYPFRHSFIQIVEELKQGATFSDTMEIFRNIYGDKLVTLLRVGEETNCLDRILFSQANDITSELEHELKQLGNVLEPALILCIGGVVAFVLIAMYMPMFQLGQTIH